MVTSRVDADMNAPMRLHAERQAIVDACRTMLSTRLVVNTAGNVSVRVGDTIAITPSGIRYERMTAEDVCLVGVDGGAEEDAALRPSSELPLHLAVYRATEALAIVHTHSVYATTVSTLVDQLPAVHYHIADLGDPVPVVPYATFGTDALAGSVASTLAGRNAVLMQNHGATTIAPDLPRALARAITLEWLAEVYCHARAIGTPSILGPDEIAAVAARQRLLADERAARMKARAGR